MQSLRKYKQPEITYSAPVIDQFNHINYSRWLPVHIADLVNLSTTHSKVYQEFLKGNFAVQKSSKVFSAMAIDQCHEQMNEVIKGTGGAVELTENPQALERWMIGGPEICRLVNEFETNFENSISQISKRHHEQNHAFQNTFSNDVSSLVSTIEAMGNPFVEDSEELLTLDTKMIKSKEVIKTIYAVEEIGQTQYRNFLEERLTATTNKPLIGVI